MIIQDWAEGPFLNEYEVAMLSDTMRDACPRGQIRWLYRLKDSVHVRAGNERAKRKTPFIVLVV